MKKSKKPGIPRLKQAKHIMTAAKRSNLSPVIIDEKRKDFHQAVHSYEATARRNARQPGINFVSPVTPVINQLPANFGIS